MTPEAYITAVKQHPGVAWADSSGIHYGYAIRFRHEGRSVDAVPYSVLLSKDRVGYFAPESTPNDLRGTVYLSEFFTGAPPSRAELRAYFINKYGKPTGLNFLFPRRIEIRAAQEIQS